MKDIQKKYFIRTAFYIFILKMKIYMVIKIVNFTFSFPDSYAYYIFIYKF